MSTGVLAAIVIIAGSGIGLIVALVSLMRPQAAVKPAVSPAANPTTPSLSPEAAERLNQQVEAAYAEQIKLSTANFAQDLTATSKRLSEQVERLTTEVIATELEQYQKTLEQVRTVAEGTAGQIKQAVEEQQAKLRESLEAAVKAEQDRRLALLDQRLGDIVSGYITESLGQGVDLGAQADYIVAALEARREDIKRDLHDGV